MVFDHSRWDSAVFASDEDETRLRQVAALVKPGVVGGWDKLTSNDRRDVMHVATAIRYAGNGFVTNDRPLLGKAPAIAEAFNHFAILNPEQALARIADAARN
jgi:hypothetical protein